MTTPHFEPKVLFCRLCVVGLHLIHRISCNFRLVVRAVNDKSNLYRQKVILTVKLLLRMRRITLCIRRGL